MTTKDFSFKDKHELFGTDKSPNGQYRNLNLNQNHQNLSFNAIFKIPKNVSTEKVLKCDFSNNHETRKNSIKNLPSNFAKDTEKRDKFKKEKTSTATNNNSTLSLHIEAYENSIETIALNSFNENFTKKHETDAKQLSSVSAFVIQNPFEFPRMLLRCRAQTPEPSYFRASQRLLNPHQINRIRAPFPEGYGARSMPPLPLPTPSPSYQYNNEEDKENVIQMMQAFQKRMNSRFNKAFFPWSQYFGVEYNKKIMSSSFEITLKKENNKFCFFVQLLPIGPVINRFGCQIATFDPKRGNEKEFIELLSEFDIVNLSFIKISESDNDLIKYSDNMLKTLLASKEYSINQAPMTIFGGYIPEYLLKKYLPQIQSSNVILRCNFGYEKPHYYDIIKAAKHQNCFHFDRKVRQKFSKKKHFIKLGETILSNPTIECFSFVCDFKRFNFNEFFKFIADPNLKIENQTINLSFSFYSNLKWIAEFVGEEIVKLNRILEDRTQHSDSIRVVFHTAKKKLRFYGIDFV